MNGRMLGAIVAVVLMSAGSAAAQQKPAEVRRVVTGIDSTGKAVALFDSAVPLKTMRSPNPAGDMWITDKYPLDFSWTADRALTKIGLIPPPNGTVFRIVDFVPLNPEAEKKMDINLMMKVVGDHAPKKGLPPKHPMMHRTRSLDYAIILSGEIDMMLDDTVVHLKAGDVVIQQATNHAWVNRGKEICRIAFILMDSQEP
jgi:mannose-6-phosphate isomerase-like protein (cupin superfamily)